MENSQWNVRFHVYRTNGKFHFSSYDAQKAVFPTIRHNETAWQIWLLKSAMMSMWTKPTAHHQRVSHVSLRCFNHKRGCQMGPAYLQHHHAFGWDAACHFHLCMHSSICIRGRCLLCRLCLSLFTHGIHRSQNLKLPTNWTYLSLFSIFQNFSGSCCCFSSLSSISSI